MKIQKQSDVKAYRGEGFIGGYQKLIKETVIPYQYSVLCDEAKDVEKSHVIQNFANAAAALKGKDVGDGFYGMVFQDSDAAKWLEAVAYSLSVIPDKALEESADKVIDLIAAAQDKDGYLNTYFTIKDKEKRWTNLQEGHELYCSGHMMEAACAYYEATGKDKLLQVMLKNAEHIYDVFITGKHEGYPGHPEVELALIKMYRTTENEHCLELAKHFIDVRGKDPDFYKKESEARNWTVWGADPSDPAYMQAAQPVREQKDAVGHAVRAVYLYTAMADLASFTEDEGLMEACDILWESITQRRMYLTGGIGSTFLGEAFSVDYDLPGDTAYAETCASIGLMFFAARMLENKVDGKYADVMEQAFYNTVLAGMQLDGKRFFYVNPLEVIPDISGVAPTHRHALPQRPGWYVCACCPPNVARLISSFGKYAYGESKDTAYCHMYAAGKVRLDNGMQFTCKTNYPCDFDIDYDIEKGGKMALRVPTWSEKFTLLVNGVAKMTEKTKLQGGYAYVHVADGDKLCLKLDGTPRVMYASSKVPALTGKKAICRGPLVYCFEGADNEGNVLSLCLKREFAVEEVPAGDWLGSKAVALAMPVSRLADTDSLYTTKRPEAKTCQGIAVPYFAWGNRGENQMRVWMDEE